MYTKNPKSFEEVKKGDEILKDNGKILKSEDNFTLLMPSYPKYVGDEICYFMKEVIKKEIPNGIM